MIHRHVSFSRGSGTTQHLWREHLRLQKVWGRKEHNDFLSFRTAPVTFLQRENILMWQSKTAASIHCFTYGCIFCDSLDCSDHRTAGEHPSSCTFHEKQLSMLSPSPSTSWANSCQKEKGSLHYTKVLNFCLSKDIFKRVERKTRVGKHICITYN